MLRCLALVLDWRVDGKKETSEARSEVQGRGFVGCANFRRWGTMERGVSEAVSETVQTFKVDVLNKVNI